jgi:hypothetical protein
MRLLLNKYPNIYVENTVLRKALLPGIEIPSFYFGVGHNQFYQVDFQGNVSPVTGILNAS